MESYFIKTKIIIKDKFKMEFVMEKENKNFKMV